MPPLSRQWQAFFDDLDTGTVSMTPAEQLHLQACRHHDTGQLTEAETLYLRALAENPLHHASLHGLGLVHHATGRARSAAALAGRAVALSPLTETYRSSLAGTLVRLGRIDDAAAACRSAVMLAPTDGTGWMTLGMVLASNPHMAGAATTALGRAVRTGAASIPVLIKLGETARLAGRKDVVVAAFRTIAALAPNDINMIRNLATVLKEQGKHDLAFRAFRQAIRIDPLFSPAFYGAGDSLMLAGRIDDAAVILRQAVVLEPAYFYTLSALGRISERQNQEADAARWFGRAAGVNPHDPLTHFNHGLFLERLNRPADSAAAYDRALALDPGMEGAHEKFTIKLNHALWRDYDRDTDRARRFVRDQGGKVLPIPFTYIPSTAAEQRLCAQRVSAQAAPPDADVWRRRFLRPAGGPDKPVLTIGYMSGDFRDHAVAYLITGLLEEHDRKRFRILGYSTGPNADGQAIRLRIEAAVDRMTCLRDLSTPQAAERINADGVDILIDLSGHTRHSRTDVLALRPAPIQVNYLGYPGTLGADFMDYIIVDPFSVPADQQPFYTERLVHLPHVYQANDRKKTAAPPQTRADYGLPDTGFVFCCFNHTAKITPGVFDIWMRLLRAVPDAVLWLLIWSPEALARLQQEAAVRGVDPARLIATPIIPQAHHLARYALADLFLDTFPYTAHTTGSDALWMGCPLVTRVGETFPSRVAGSLLHAFGVPELVTETPEAYEAVALDLARNRERLSTLRAALLSRRVTTPVYDTPRFARHMEQAFEAMWRLHRSGQPPQPIQVMPVPPTDA